MLRIQFLNKHFQPAQAAKSEFDHITVAAPDSVLAMP